MKTAVVIGAYNEENHISHLLDALLAQTQMPDEVVIVDDGSIDKTTEVIKKYSKKNPFIKYIYQKNAGPAAARNKAWKASSADICIFTDGDCVPEPNWISEILKPFEDDSVGAVAGTYKTVNTKSILARFIGWEIAWRYRNISGEIEAHGTYNLAVRKRILEKVGGLNEEYPKASGEDWDMTYKISKTSKIIFNPKAIVGHYHPEDFWWYMKNQVRRGFDRVKVYKDHPDMMSGDNYSGKLVLFQVLSAGAFLPSLIFIYPFFKFSYFIPLAIFTFLFLSSFISFPFITKKDFAAALYGIPVQLARNFAWFLGLLKGIIKYGI